jgi:hypothetical protein
MVASREGERIRSVERGDPLAALLREVVSVNNKRRAGVRLVHRRSAERFTLPSGCSIGTRNGQRTCSELVPAEATRVKAATRRADYILMARDVQSEGRALAGSKAEAVAALSWEELDAYDQTVEEVVGPSGTQYRLSTSVFWDMEPWASGVIVKAAPTRGWRRFWPFKAVEVRGGPDDLVPEKATG